MKLSQVLKEETVNLNITQGKLPDKPVEEYTHADRWKMKENVIRQIVELIDRSGLVGNKKKLLLDFINREKRCTTAIGSGIAIPHVRTMQVRGFVFAIGISKEGVYFASIDGAPTHIFFILASPPYDDSDYLQIYRRISELVQNRNISLELTTTESPGELIRVVKSFLE
ncbi:PTS sugar transporter subunit IIA [bacterium]|nr:PTS sugar transporter subunit IIA [bacterium]